MCLIVRLVKRSLHATRHLPPATLFKSPATHHPLLATRHPLPATRYLSPATRHPLFVTPHPWKSAAEEKWPPLQLLTERLEKQTNKKKQAKTHHLIQHAIQPECAKTHQTNPAPQANKATQIKRKCKDAQPQHKKLPTKVFRNFSFLSFTIGDMP